MKSLVYIVLTALYCYAAIDSFVDSAWGWLIAGLVIPPVGVLRGLYALIMG